MRVLVEAQGVKVADGHDLGGGRVVGVEHVVEHALEEGNLVGRVGGGQLRELVRGRVDEGVDAGAVVLVERAADLEVVVVDGGVGCGDVGGDDAVRDVFEGGFVLAA